MKKFFLLKVSLFLLAILFFSTSFISAQIIVSSDFEGGNGSATFTDFSTNEVDIVSDLKGGDTKNISYYVKITGLDATKNLLLKVDAFWRGPTLVYSYDNITWHKTNVDNFVFTIPLISSTVYVAHSFPYTYSQMIADVDAISSFSHVNVYDMAISEENRPVKLVRITEDCVEDEGKELIWIFGRMHAFENPGNHSVKGMIDFFVSNHPSAKRLREEAIIYIVPMMDVDQAYHGGSGKDQTPVDFNRDWGAVNSPSHWSAVKEAKRWMDSTAQLNNFSVFMDSHSPPPSQQSFFYYIYDSDHQISNARFVKESIQHIGNYQATEYIFAHLDQNISQDYVLINYDSPAHYNTTMETGFNRRTDQVDWTQELYELNGVHHAEAMSDYVHGIAKNGDIIVDNKDSLQVEFNGVWSSGTTELGYLGDDYIYADPQNPAEVVFNATVDAAGTYEVFTRWVSRVDFATNAPVVISHLGGDSNYNLDMSIRGGHWVSLDVFELEAGEQVSLAISNANADGIVIADGLRISKVGSCEGVTVPEMSSSTTSFDFNIYPNPTQQSTSVSFEITKKSKVKITIYNSFGKAIKTLVDRDFDYGKHEMTWDGTDHDGVLVDGGIYYCQLQINDQFSTKKLLIVK